MDETHLEMAEKLSLAEVTAGVSRCRIKQVKPEKFDGTCECGQDINPDRIALGYYNCVWCQAKKERRT